MMIDLIVAIVGIAASILTFLINLRFVVRFGKGPMNLVWLLFLAALLVIAGSEIIDATTIFRPGARPRIADLLVIFAEICLAVGFIRLFYIQSSEEQTRLNYAEVLANATHQLSTTLEVEEVLKNTVHQTSKLTDADIVALYLTSAGGSVGTPTMIYESRKTGTIGERQIPRGEFSSLILESGKFQKIEDLAHDPRTRSNQASNLTSLAGFPLILHGAPKGILYIGYQRRHRFTENEEYIMELFARHVVLAIHNAELHQQVEELSLHDSLTGLANRRFFDQRLAEELGRARRYGKYLSLILIDVDHFKSINDTWGHPAGDVGLKSLAFILEKFTREVDLPARVGGEEFAVILPETLPDDARAVAERIRAEVERTAIPWADILLHTTCSIGLIGETGTNLPENTVEMYRLADQALYRAKESGRNRIIALAPRGVCKE